MSLPVNNFIEMEARFGAHNYAPLGVVLSRGEGVFVWDTQGNRYLDCLSAYSAVEVSPKLHPATDRTHWLFEPVWLGDATGWGAEPPVSSSVPSRCISDAMSLA